MARMARAVFADIPHHVTKRGNLRQQVFFKEEDYCRVFNIDWKFVNIVAARSK